MLSTTLSSGSWDPAREIWTLAISTRGKKSTITCSNIVFAVGVGSQVPVKPVYENEVSFQSFRIRVRLYIYTLPDFSRVDSKA